MQKLLSDVRFETEANRAELRAQENVQFVNRQQYCKLLVANRVLNRCDVPSARVRGIYDPALGRRYFIEEERVFPD